MTFAAVQGQPRAVAALEAAVRSGSVHHAYLFAGPEGVGKELCAVGLAQALLCLARPGEGCGSCEVCVRVERRAHPDVTWVMPEDEQVERGLAGRSDFDHTPSRDLRVEQVRALQERLALRPLEGRWKVAILASAQAMNPQAQNAFLKTLEEPPRDTVLVLLASAPDRLLPTIRSRCAKVQFGPLPAAVVAERVARERKIDAATAELVAFLAGGSFARAFALDVKALERRREIIERYEALSPSDARSWLRFAEEQGASRENAEACLQILALWLRDVGAAMHDGDRVANRDLCELARKTAEGRPPTALHRRMLLVDQAHNAVTSRNGSARLALERMLIETFAP